MNRKAGAEHVVSIEFGCLSVIFHFIVSFKFAFDIAFGKLWTVHNIIILAFGIMAAIHFNYKKLSVLGKDALKQHKGILARELLYMLFELVFIYLCTKQGDIFTVVGVAVMMGVIPCIKSTITLNFSRKEDNKSAKALFTERLIFILVWCAMLLGAVIWRVL